jgi:signal transduction histidine kinase
LDEGRLELSVTDDGVEDPESFEPGRGITGMRERASVHGGTVSIDRSEGGGTELRANLNWGPSE